MKWLGGLRKYSKLTCVRTIGLSAWEAPNAALVPRVTIGG